MRTQICMPVPRSQLGSKPSNNSYHMWHASTLTMHHRMPVSHAHIMPVPHAHKDLHASCTRQIWQCQHLIHIIRIMPAQTRGHYATGTCTSYAPCQFNTPNACCVPVQIATHTLHASTKYTHKTSKTHTHAPCPGRPEYTWPRQCTATNPSCRCGPSTRTSTPRASCSMCLLSS